MPQIISPRTFDGEYNVMAYGAKGDGVTDDSAAIQRALDAAFNAGGGIVNIPEGNYLLVAAGVYVRTNVHIRCSSRAKIIKGADVVLLFFGEPGVTNGSGWDGHHDMSLTGGTWDMKGATLTTYRVGMATGHNRNISLRDVIFLDTPGHHAIEVNSAKGVRITNCQFKGFYHTGDRGFSEAIQIDLAKDSSIGTTAPYDHTSCEDVRVTGCYFGASGTVGTIAWPRAVGSHSSTIGVRHRNIIVDGNTFEALTGTAVGPYSWDHAVISNNIFDNCVGGVNAETPNPADTGDTLNTSGVQTSDSQDCTGLTVTGNTFRGIGTEPSVLVTAYGTKYYNNVAVIGNSSTGSGAVNSRADGIALLRTRNSTISGNNVSGTGDIGISCITGDYLTIGSNTVNSTQTIGIQVSGYNDVVISDNVLRNIGEHGLLIIGGSDVCIKNNNIKGVSRNNNNSFYGMRITQSVSGFNITGNRIRKFGSGNELAKGISIASTCTGAFLNRNDIQDTGFEDQGSTSPATSGNGLSSAVVVTEETTASTTYGNLTTTGPSVTIDTGTSAIIIISGQIYNDTALGYALVTYEVSGATTIAASDNNAMLWRNSNVAITTPPRTAMSVVKVETGLNPGTNTFTLKYKALTAGTAAFSRRTITVIPLNL